MTREQGKTAPAVPQMSFVSCVQWNDEGPFSTFKDALANFMPRMRKLVQDGTSLQVIETLCYIELKSGEHQVPLFFYDVRDFAHQAGLMKDGQLVEDAPEPDAGAIGKVFAVSLLMGEAEMLVRDTERKLANLAAASSRL